MRKDMKLPVLFIGLIFLISGSQGLVNGDVTVDISQLTANDYKDAKPQNSGRNSVWQGKVDGEDFEIFFNDGQETSQLTDNDANDIRPQVWHDQVVWQGQTFNDPNDPNDSDWEIFYDDGEQIKQLTDNDRDDIRPQISGNKIVWQGISFDPNDPNDNDWEIFAYVDGKVIQLTDNHFDDKAPQISGCRVVWQGRDPNSWEIFTAILGEPLDFDMKFTPQSLNINSKGKYVQVKLHIPREISPEDVLLSSLLLEETLSPVSCKITGHKIKCKYDRSDVADLLEVGNKIKVTVSGELEDGRLFEASDVIKVIDKGGKKNHPHPASSANSSNHPGKGNK